MGFVIVSGLAIGMVFAAVALVYNVMYSTSKVLSVTTGHLAMLGGVFGAWFIAQLHWHWALGLLGAMVVGAAFGWLTDLLAIRRVLARSDEHLWLLSTLALATMVQQGVGLWWGTEPKPFPRLLPQAFGAGIGDQKFWLPIVLALVMAVGLDRFYRRTMYGKLFLAMSEDAFAARARGVSTDRIRELSYKGTAIARGVADEMGVSADGTPRFVLGSIGPGTKLPSLGHTTFEIIRNAYFECVAGMLDGGADAILVETSQDLLQVKAAVIAARRAMAELGRSIPIISHVTVETTGTMLLGSEIGAALTYGWAWFLLETTGRAVEQIDRNHALDELAHHLVALVPHGHEVAVILEQADGREERRRLAPLPERPQQQPGAAAQQQHQPHRRLLQRHVAHRHRLLDVDARRRVPRGRRLRVLVLPDERVVVRVRLLLLRLLAAPLRHRLRPPRRRRRCSARGVPRGGRRASFGARSLRARAPRRRREEAIDVEPGRATRGVSNECHCHFFDSEPGILLTPGARGGREAALEQARKAANGKDVRIGGGVSTIRQYLQKGLVDELHFAISPVFLGEGENLFAGLNLPKMGFKLVEQKQGEGALHVVLRKG